MLGYSTHWSLSLFSFNFARQFMFSGNVTPDFTFSAEFLQFKGFANENGLGNVDGGND